MGSIISNVVRKTSEVHVREKITNNSHDKLTQLYANNIINEAPYKKTVVYDTGAVGHYLKSYAPHFSINKHGTNHSCGIPKCPNHTIMKTMFTGFPRHT